MKSPMLSPAGTTLPEILIVLVILSIVSALGIPRLQRTVQSMRTRTALNQVTGEIYRARMVAVESGRPAYLVLRSMDGCITRLQVKSDLDSMDDTIINSDLDVADLCLRHSGDSILVFNGRGMLRPPARSIFAADLNTPDTVLLSIAGRVRRSY